MGNLWDRIEHEGWLWLLAGAIAVLIVAAAITLGSASSGAHGSLNSVVGFIDNRAAPDGPNQPVIGSGVIVDGGSLVLTAAHVVGAEAKIGDVWRLKFADGSIHSATLEAFDAKQDIAVLQLDDPSANWSSLNCEVPAAEGQSIIVRGYPVDLGLVTSRGYIVRGNTKEMPWFVAGYWPEGFLLTDAAVTYGNSGGPAYDLDGHVLGMVGGIVTVPVGMGSTVSTQLSIVIEAATLCSFVENYLDFQVIKLKGELAIQDHKIKHLEKSLTPTD